MKIQNAILVPYPPQKPKAAQQHTCGGVQAEDYPWPNRPGKGWLPKPGPLDASIIGSAELSHRRNKKDERILGAIVQNFSDLF